MSYIGGILPDININSVNHKSEEEIFNFSNNNIKTLLFWYPKDFTFVCPTEIHAFQEKLSEFIKRGYRVIVATCDTIQIHLEWLKTSKKNAGIEGITFPLISDPRRTLSKKLKILGKDNVTYRATYLIDENNLVYYESINEMSIGRNIDELLRIIDAKIHHDLNGEVCPANWILGKKALKESTESVKKYFSNLK